MGLTEKYAEIHFSAAESVRRGDYSPDVVPVTGGSRWGLSLVALPEPAIARRLAKTALALSGAASNPHVAYQPNDIHITVRSLEGHEHQVSEETVTNYLRRIRRLTENLGEIQIDVRGLSATRGGVIACGYPNDTLAILRSRLLQDWQAHGFESIPGGDGEGNRDTAHSSLMVFRPGELPGQRRFHSPSPEGGDFLVNHQKYTREARRRPQPPLTAHGPRKNPAAPKLPARVTSSWPWTTGYPVPRRLQLSRTGAVTRTAHVMQLCAGYNPRS